MIRPRSTFASAIAQEQALKLADTGTLFLDEIGDLPMPL